MQHAKYAIGRLKERYLKRKKHLSLNYTQNEDFSEYSELIDSGHKTPENEMMNLEFIEHIGTFVDQRKFEILKKKYIKNMTLIEIAKEYDITKQRVEQIISSVIKEIKDNYEDEY